MRAAALRQAPSSASRCHGRRYAPPGGASPIGSDGGSLVPSDARPHRGGSSGQGKSFTSEDHDRQWREELGAADVEILERSELLMRRHDAAELIAIRDGALSFDELLATAARLEQDMQRAAARTTLPEDVDHEHADRLAVELMLEARA